MFVCLFVCFELLGTTPGASFKVRLFGEKYLLPPQGDLQSTFVCSKYFVAHNKVLVANAIINVPTPCLAEIGKKHAKNIIFGTGTKYYATAIPPIDGPPGSHRVVTG